jgi:hypothetical protein
MSKNCQKIVKSCQNCQKVVKKYQKSSKSCQKMSKRWQKIDKKLAKFVKKFSKNVKIYQKSVKNLSIICPFAQNVRRRRRRRRRRLVAPRPGGDFVAPGKNQKLTCWTPLAANRTPNRMGIRMENRTCRQPLSQ